MAKSKKEVFNLFFQSTIVIGLGEKFSPDHCYEFLEYMFGFDGADERIFELCSTFFGLTSSKNEPIVRSLSIALLVTAREF